MSTTPPYEISEGTTPSGRSVIRAYSGPACFWIAYATQSFDDSTDWVVGMGLDAAAQAGYAWSRSPVFFVADRDQARDAVDMLAQLYFARPADGDRSVSGS